MGAESKFLKLKEKEHLEKLKIINSIIRSQRIIGKNSLKKAQGSVSTPDLATLAEKSLDELRDLKIAQLEYQDETVSFTLNDGQTCKAGTTVFDKKQSMIDKFDQKKKITKVECIINRKEEKIIRINFFSN